MKVIMGLGNPGPRYDDTRHNVGWWAVDRMAYEWGLGSFQRSGPVLDTEGLVEGTRVRLVKPTAYMNRSGVAVRELEDDVDTTEDLLVVLDDAAIDVGRLRLRPGGSDGGHNGLRSISSALGHREYARLRIGVGRNPVGVDLADWVLAPMPADDEEAVLASLLDACQAATTWIAEGAEAAMNKFNR